MKYEVIGALDILKSGLKTFLKKLQHLILRLIYISIFFLFSKAINNNAFLEDRLLQASISCLN